MVQRMIARAAEDAAGFSLPVAQGSHCLSKGHPIVAVLFDQLADLAGRNAIFSCEMFHFVILVHRQAVVVEEVSIALVVGHFLSPGEA
ncbi:hypothetical protein BQ8482_380134 [Mesorhizobium delmotii]|uniref:Uncharacterized protein n=1 Tax=Mesorhizobium delmotii TaxID=1631247 RepID=A0A2P9AS14_9HYPH|nr:hypothetical protein BQ8482_380134 [Mesorhizobium delmotii]